MTAEQLEELANGFATHLHSEETIQSLARRVLAAEKLVEALEDFQECDCKRHNCATCAWFSDADEALTAYREANQ